MMMLVALVMVDDDNASEGF